MDTNDKGIITLIETPFNKNDSIPEDEIKLLTIEEMIKIEPDLK